MNALAPAALGKLARICGMLGSEHDGERAAAALQADRLVRGAGTTWEALLAPSVAAPRQSEARRPRVFSPGELLANYGPALTPWERCFLATLVKHSGWSKKQRAVLDDIRARFS